MELRHLRYFLAVAEAGHFGRAAERVHVSQPALSQQIQDLEREVGAPLFERHARGVRLTPVGEVFLEHAQTALSAVADGIAKAREIFQGTAGRIVVGLAETSTAAALAMRAINTVRATHPKIEIETSGLPWLEQPRALLAGVIDIGLCWSPGDGQPMTESYPGAITAERLLDDPGDHALLPSEHPLAARAQIAAEDLRSLPFGLFEKSLHPALHFAIAETVMRAGISPPTIARGVGSAAGSIPLLIARQGWTFISRSVSREKLPGTVARPISDMFMPAGLDVIYRTGEPNPLIATFVSALRCSLATERV
jgi:DNA-binding transcriptional LysR family regulator